MHDDWVDLYWLPLGAGGRCVRANGRLDERIVAAREHRTRHDLYHSALQVRCAGTTYAVEMGPVWNVPAGERGVVQEGAEQPRNHCLSLASSYPLFESEQPTSC